MAYNNGFPETYQNGYLQNNYLPYPYNQQQYSVGQTVHTPTQNYSCIR